MPFHCCYGNCNSDSRVGRPGYDADVKFYRFPQPCLLLRDNVLTWSDSDERQHLKSCKKCTIAHTWLVRCKRADSRFQKVRHIRTSSYLCSRHFDDPPARIDYERHFPSSVPSNNLSFLERSQRLKKRLAKKSNCTAGDANQDDIACLEEEDTDQNVTTLSLLETSSEPFEGPSPEEDLAYPFESPATTVPSSSQTSLLSSDISVMEEEARKWKCYAHSLEREVMLLKADVKVGPISELEKKLRSSDRVCKNYTGLTNAQFNVLLAFTEGINITYWGVEKDEAVGPVIEKQAAHVHPKRTLTRCQELILFFMRIRAGLLLRDMAIRFSLPESVISRTVTTWVLALSGYFGSMRKEMFFDRNVIKKHLPLRFKSSTFKNIRVIIDCAEIRCQTPSNFEQQGNVYSEYKAHTTFKILIGCAPNGAVTFISEPYEGSISDRAIFQRSGILDLLEPGDLVLADRGFTVKDICEAKGVVLKSPAFLKGRDKLTPQEEMETREIAANRIFVEHIVGRLKHFRILQRVLPQSMRHILPHIVFVCGCLINFQEPLLK